MLPLTRTATWLITVIILALLAGILGLSAAPARAYGSLTLDGVRDDGYGSAIGMDASSDLANPGPGEWSGTAWTDQTALYCQNDDTHLYVYADLPQYSQSASSGQIGLLVDNGTTAGGTADPWGNAITFGHANKPDYIIRGNIAGMQGGDNGWTELRAWSGSAWSVGGTNWGGISSGGQVGSKVAYANANGVEFKIPLSDIGSPAFGASLNLEFFATQSGGAKGAYDTVPTDDQSTGWDDATTLVNWATCTLTTSGPTGTPTATATLSPTLTPTQPSDCTGAAAGDSVIVTTALYHNDTDAAYRVPTGNILPTGQAQLRLRACHGDVQSVQVLVWKTGDSLASPSFTYDAAVASSDGTYDLWEATVPGPNYVVDQWYQFRVADADVTGQFNPVSGNTGPGKWYTGALADPSWKLGTDAGSTATPTFTPTPGGPTATPTATMPADCAGAAAGDDSIRPAAIYHLDTDPTYRTPVGDILPDGSARLRLRTCQGDVQQVSVLVWLTGAGATPSFTYAAAVTGSDPAGPYDIWEATVPGPGYNIHQWYQFKVVDGAAVGHYHPAGGNTGPGVWVNSAAPVDPSWKLGTTPAPPADYVVPDWMQDAVIYQIFPDRFRDGDATNNAAGATVYGPNTCNGYSGAGAPACVTSLHSSWTELPVTPGYGIDFFGGDLAGITEKINAGYFNDLGVNVLYLNPVFAASSNHGYDTNDYYQINPRFGTLADFDALIAAAHAHGLRVILDGVFNHAGMDSLYIDKNKTQGGACASASSPYRPWFTAGGNGAAFACDDGWGWKGWYGYETIPEFVDDNADVRQFFFKDGSSYSPGGLSVTHYWLNRGIAGWRFDVAQDITHSWWQEMRPYVKTTYGSSDTLMLGEVTGGCYPYQDFVNAKELDSAMNYCFRDWSRDWANGGAPSSFDTSWNNFRNNMAPAAWRIMMNLLSSHDSPRVYSNLNGDKARIKLAVLLQMTLPGAPSVYYGDEVGLPGSGDPDNRRTYPWADKGGSPDTDMYAHFKKIIGLRNTYSALRRGDMATLLVSDASYLYSFIRWDATQSVVVVLNNGTSAANATIPVASYLADGTMLTDVLNGGTFTVAGGHITASVTGQWGRILVASKLVASAARETSGAVKLSWNSFVGAASYRVLRAANAPYFAPAADPVSAGQQIYGGSDLSHTDPAAHTASSAINDFYLVQALDASENVLGASNRTGEFTFDVTPGAQ